MEAELENNVSEFPAQNGKVGFAEKLLTRYDRIDDNLDHIKSTAALCFAYAESPSQMESNVILTAMQDVMGRVERIERDLEFIRKKG